MHQQNKNNNRSADNGTKIKLIYVKKKNKSRISSLETSPSLSLLPFVDSVQALTSTSTTVSTLSVATAFQGLFATYPQRGTPTYQGTTGFRLRQRIAITHCELRMQIIGSQSNAILPADLYNSVRIAFYRSGKSFVDTNNSYLLGVINGTRVLDVDRVFFDKTLSLPTQAFDAASGYNVPQVINLAYHIDVNQVMDWYSLTASGTTTWETEKYDYLIDFVSDSSVAPHPTVGWNLRWFFKFQ